MKKDTTKPQPPATVTSIASVTSRRPAWVKPTVERRGSVADLVQIHKISGSHDSGKSGHDTF